MDRHIPLIDILPGARYALDAANETILHLSADPQRESINMVDFEQETKKQIKENESQVESVGKPKVFSLNCGNADEAFAQLKILMKRSCRQTLILNWTQVRKLMRSRNIFLIKSLGMSS